jgi:hypothetical protein
VLPAACDWQFRAAARRMDVRAGDPLPEARPAAAAWRPALSLRVLPAECDWQFRAVAHPAAVRVDGQPPAVRLGAHSAPVLQRERARQALPAASGWQCRVAAVHRAGGAAAVLPPEVCLAAL